MDVSPHTTMQGIRRWWSGESRGHNIAYVETIMGRAFGHIAMYAERAARAAECSVEMPDCDTSFMRRLARELRGARTGCQGLQATYDADNVSHARLACLIESVDDHTRIIERWCGVDSLVNSIPAHIPTRLV